MNESPIRPPIRTMKPLWLLFLVFAAPVMAAWFLYLNPQYLPSGRTNRGELIESLVSLPSQVLIRDSMGREIDRSSHLEGRWTLVVLARSPCDQSCRAQLQLIRQVRLALGESRFSVERLLMQIGEESNFAASLKDSLADLDGVYLASIRGPLAETFLSQLGDEASSVGRIYILDPMGRLMMRYAFNAPAKDLLKDMERLLKASKNWIKGAQYGHR